MKFLDSEEYRRSRQTRVLHTGPTLTREEGRLIFREMVRAESRNGHLSASRRRKLVQYAAALQLTPTEAGRIVTDVCRENQVDLTDAPPLLYRAVEAAASHRRWPAWLKIMITLLAAFSVDRLIRHLW